jgi:hypothetical protein
MLPYSNVFVETQSIVVLLEDHIVILQSLKSPEIVSLVEPNGSLVVVYYV